MSLITALDINASGLTAQRYRAEVASSNLANSQTTRTPEGGPYRRKDVVFETVPLSKAFDIAASGINGVEVAGVMDEPTPFDRRYEPNHPDADAEKGYVEYPNVNSMEEMANLLEASRSYEANISAVNIIKAMIARTLEIGR
jgi:flagellar basal-body rod protein FlgC